MSASITNHRERVHRDVRASHRTTINFTHLNVIPFTKGNVAFCPDSFTHVSLYGAATCCVSPTCLCVHTTIRLTPCLHTTSRMLLHVHTVSKRLHLGRYCDRGVLFDWTRPRAFDLPCLRSSGSIQLGALSRACRGTASVSMALLQRCLDMQLIATQPDAISRVALYRFAICSHKPLTSIYRSAMHESRIQVLHTNCILP